MRGMSGLVIRPIPTTRIVSGSLESYFTHFAELEKLRLGIHPPILMVIRVNRQVA
jgi:hypothetical protein